jgi:hypothetical protein
VADFILDGDEVQGIIAEDVGPDNSADFGREACEEGAFSLLDEGRSRWRRR